MEQVYDSDLAKAVALKIQAALPGAFVEVDDPDGAHLSACVTSAAFVGLNRIAQHKLVYAALGNAFENELHALQLVTRVPA